MIGSMRVVIGLIVLALVGGFAGIVCARRLDPVCAVQMLKHAAADDRAGWNCLSYAAARGDLRIAGDMKSRRVDGDLHYSLVPDRESQTA